MTGLLAVIGDLVQDIVVWSDTAVSPGDDNPSTIYVTRGGSAANVAVAAAALGPTRFIGRVGHDGTGVLLADQLRARGVDVQVQRAGRTGTIVVLVDGLGERTMFPDRAAAAELTPVPPEWLDGIAALHAPSYAFTTTSARAAVVEAMAHARRQGALRSIDVSSVQLVRAIGVAAYLELLTSIGPDVLFANGPEAELLGLPEALAGMVTMVLKDGPRPVRVVTPEGTQTVAVPPVSGVRDTTGAGDAFTAGYLHAALAGTDPAGCAAAGNRIAAGTLGAPGG